VNDIYESIALSAHWVDEFLKIKIKLLISVVEYLLNTPFVGAVGGSVSLLDDNSSATDFPSDIDLSFSF